MATIAAPAGGKKRTPLPKYAFYCLCFLVALNLVTILQVRAEIEALVVSADPRWSPPLSDVMPTFPGLAAINILGLAMIYFRRRAGFWIFFGASTVMFALNLSLGVPISEATPLLLQPLLLLALMRPQWKMLK